MDMQKSRISDKQYDLVGSDGPLTVLKKLDFAAVLYVVNSYFGVQIQYIIILPSVNNALQWISYIQYGLRAIRNYHLQQSATTCTRIGSTDLLVISNPPGFPIWQSLLCD